MLRTFVMASEYLHCRLEARASQSSQITAQLSSITLATLFSHPSRIKFEISTTSSPPHLPPALPAEHPLLTQAPAGCVGGYAPPKHRRKIACCLFTSLHAFTNRGGEDMGDCVDRRNARISGAVPVPGVGVGIGLVA